ncbi:MAG: hypothetical protein H7282_12040 [Cytophagaceae bacterium]|nr:hypothetical protein [Cytophagaceae bacterium]
MKHYKNIFLVITAIAVTLIMASFASNSKETDFILVRTMESHSMMNMAKTMIISYSNGHSERVPLKSIELGASTAEENLNVEVAKIKEIMDSGYELKNYSGGGGGNGIVYTYLFVKN